MGLESFVTSYHYYSYVQGPPYLTCFRSAGSQFVRVRGRIFAKVRPTVRIDTNRPIRCREVWHMSRAVQMKIMQRLRRIFDTVQSTAFSTYAWCANTHIDHSG
jgi:hypothetical protein